MFKEFTYLKSILKTGRVNLCDWTSKCIRYKLFNLRHNISVHIKINVRLLLLDYFRKIRKCHFVSILELTIIICMYLDCIVSQMNKFIWNVIVVEFFAWCPYVAILVKVTFQRSIYRCHNTIASEIEFPFVYQKWIVDILLYDKSPVSLCRPTNYRLYFLHRFTNIYPVASISIFPRLNNPCVFRNSILHFELLNFRVITILTWIVFFVIFTFSYFILPHFLYDYQLFFF